MGLRNSCVHNSFPPPIISIYYYYFKSKNQAKSTKEASKRRS